MITNVRVLINPPTGKNVLFGLAVAAIMLVGPVGAQQFSASASPAAGSISGQIVDRDTDEPVPDLTFTLKSVYHRLELRGETDAQGKFYVTGAREDEYELVIEDAIWVDPGTNLAFVVLEGQAVEGLRFEVARGGVITGRVYAQDTTQGVAGVRVAAEHGKYDRKTGAISEPSGLSGEYAITGLDEGTYVVRVIECPGYAEPRGHERREVPVRSTERVEGIDFVLRRSPRVFGLVVDWKGNPIADAQVIAWPNRTHSDDPVKLTARSADDGSFEIVGLDPMNTFRPHVVKEGWVHEPLHHIGPSSASLDGLLIVMYPQCSISGRVVDASGQPLSDASVTMTWRSTSTTSSLVPAKTTSSGYFKKNGLLAGRYNIGVSPELEPELHVITLELEHGEDLTNVILTYDPDAGLTISGRVTDTDSRPMVNAQIWCGGPTFANAATDEGGYYVLRGLEEGEYSLTVDHDVHRYLEGHRVEAGATDVDFVLEPRQTSQVAGRVVSADTDEPVTSFSYVLKPGVYDDVDPNAKKYRDILESVHKSNFRKVSHPDGRFAAKTYDTGDHTMLVRAEGYARSALAVSAPVEGIVVSMTPGVDVEGVVLNPWGKPAAGAVIIEGLPRGYAAPYPNSAYVLGRSRRDGTFHLKDLSPSAQVLSAWHKDFGPHSITVTPGAEARTKVTFRLTPVHTVEGRVSFNGQVVDDMEQAEIRVTYQNGALGYAGLLPTRRGGTYQLKRLPSGIADVTVKLDPYGRGTYPEWSMTRTIVTEGKTITRLNFDFPGGNAVLTGTVFTSGQKLQQAHIHILYLVDDAKLMLPTDTDSNGRYRLDGLPEGNARVHVFATAQNGERLEQTFDLPIEGGAVIRRDIGIPAE